MASMSRKNLRKAVWVLAGLLLLAWLGPAFLSAERYRLRLAAGLERILKRQVDFRTITYRLLPRPGFTIENVTVQEAPAFGAEPFAHVERIDCDLRWSSIWHGQMELSNLYLTNPNVNFVRNARGEWNVEDLLRKGNVVAARNGPGAPAEASPVFRIEVDEGRVNFRLGEEKQPFAINDVRAGINLDPATGRLQFSLEGSPLRTDLTIPSPGPAQLQGVWTPQRNLDGPLDATLLVRSSMFSNWIPVVAGRDLGLYGVLNATLHLTGSVRVVGMEGDVTVLNLHRWEEIPPADNPPLEFQVKAQFDRTSGRLVVDNLQAHFARSDLKLSGTVEDIPAQSTVNLVLAIPGSRVGDWMALAQRVSGAAFRVGVSGSMEGIISARGPWRAREYGGSISVRQLRINAAAGTFPVTDAAIVIDKRGAHLSPVQITLGPNVEVMAEGGVRRTPQGPVYGADFSWNSLPLHGIVGAGRSLGIPILRFLDASGAGSGHVRVTGSAWPPAKPSVDGVAQLRAARLFVPGLTEALNVPRATLQINGNSLVVDPVVAVIGTSVFNGRLEHSGARGNPWLFKLRTPDLIVDQAALWFDVLGHRQPLASLLARLPMIGSSAGRREAASSLFSALRATGSLSVGGLKYRNLYFKEFSSEVRISDRHVELSKTSFHAWGGHGKAVVKVALTTSPPDIAADVELDKADLQTLDGDLPSQLRRVRGQASFAGHFTSRGLTTAEFLENLQGKGTLRFHNVNWGGFNPAQSAAHAAGFTFRTTSGGNLTRNLNVPLTFHGLHVIMDKTTMGWAGSRLEISGEYDFGTGMNLAVTARFLPESGENPAGKAVDQQVRLVVSGSLKEPQTEVVKESNGTNEAAGQQIPKPVRRSR
jgi:AsmA family/AsmA-like C-terminal region